MSELDEQSLLGRLAAEGAEIVVVGGFAALYHGSSLLTVDVDVCYRPTPDNRERVVRALAPLAPYLRGVDPGLPFAWDARTLATTPLMTLETTSGPIDLLPDISGVGDFEAVLARSTPASLFDVTVAVLTLDALIDAKRAAGRPKDLLVLPELEALRAAGP